MPEKKQEILTVTDRRLFTTEGEPRAESKDEQPVAQTVAPAELATPPAPAPETAEPMASETEAPTPPTADEQKQQHEAYRKSAKELDARVELSGHSAKDLEMTFERFMASLYMTAMLQLGLMREESAQPRIDIIGECNASTNRFQ